MKDILVQIRDRADLIVLLLMPFILIAILGFALRGLMEGETNAIDIQVAVVQEDDEQQGISQFIEELEEQNFPEEAAAELQFTAEEISPYTMLQDTLSSEEISNMIDTVEMDASEAKQALEEEEVAGILTIPENFTRDSLMRLLLNEGEGSELEVTITDHTSLQTSVFHDIIDGFVRTLNFETEISRSLGDEAYQLNEAAQNIGGKETVTTQDPITSIQYYTIGMAVMFVLFVAGTISAKAFVEKNEHVFNRILLSGKHSSVYLAGKVVSASLIAFAQFVILFSLSTLVFRSFAGETLEFWLGMMFISAMLSLCVGGLTALLTALTLRFNTQAVSSVFTSGIVSVFAFTGGSFFPTDGLPEVIKTIGDWTPNGAALSAYLQWMQGFEMDALVTPLIRIAGMTVFLIVLSILLFPKRRSV